MSKIVKLIILLLITLNACAPKDSLVEKEFRPYLEFENGIAVNDSLAWGEFNHRFYIPIGFTYEFLGASFDSVEIETTGRLIFDSDHLFFADAFTEISLQDLGFKNGRSLSPITYKNELTESGEVLVIEFKQATFSNDPLSRVNFQIRIYENSNDFELHMGPNKINDFSKAFKNGPYAAINRVVSYSPLIYDHSLAIYGDPLNLQVAMDSGEGLDSVEYKLTDIPLEGSVYRFKTTLPNFKQKEEDSHKNKH